MYVDSQTQFSSAQAVTATAVGTNVIDLVTAQSIGNGEAMAVVFTIGVAADQTTGDEDYTFQVEYASNAAQSAGRQLIGERIYESGTPTAPAQDADLLVVGYRVVIPIPPTQAGDDEQFIGIRYVVAGTTPTITCDAMLLPMSMIDQDVTYASGYSVT